MRALIIHTVCKRQTLSFFIKCVTSSRVLTSYQSHDIHTPNSIRFVFAFFHSEFCSLVFLFLFLTLFKPTTKCLNVFIFVRSFVVRCALMTEIRTKINEFIEKRTRKTSKEKKQQLLRTMEQTAWQTSTPATKIHVKMCQSAIWSFQNYVSSVLITGREKCAIQYLCVECASTHYAQTKRNATKKKCQRKQSPLRVAHRKEIHDKPLDACLLFNDK